MTLPSFEEKVQVKFGGKEQLTAGDIGKNLTSFQVLNPELVICNMDKSVEIDMDLTIEKGRGYIPSEENKKATSPLGTIFIDSIFCILIYLKSYTKKKG